MLQALIFDFDGVVIDSEPFHFAGFQSVIQEDYGIGFTEQEYYDGYLAYTDVEGFQRLLEQHGVAYDHAVIARLVEKKTDRLLRMLANDTRPLPGAMELMRAARAAGLGVAICSGALRREIELAGLAIGMQQFVQTIVAAEDVPLGKPDPAGYRLAHRRLGEKLGCNLPADSIVVIEDAPAGIAAAKAAGLKVLAVATSTSPDKLTQADKIVASLADATLDDLRAIVA